MSQQNVVRSVDPSDDESTLRYVQGKRVEIIEYMTLNGIPTDNEDRNTLLRALEGMSSTASANKRVKSDDRANAREAEAKAMMLGILANLKGGGVGVMFRSERPIERPPVEVPAEIRQKALPVPGETDIGVSTETFEDFAEKHDL